MKYSVYKSEMEYITSGFYELTGTTSSEKLIECGYKFVCFANTKKEAEKISRSLWEVK